MRILLDTHILLWWILDDRRLSDSSRQLMLESRELYWSAASSWEVAIKYGLGRLPLPDAPHIFIPQQLLGNQISSLPVTDRHGFRAGALPRLHRDPFDRLLVAQALEENLAILSDDAMVMQYEVQVVG